MMGLKKEGRTTLSKRGRKGLLSEEQLDAIGEAMITDIGLQQASQKPDFTNPDLRNKLTLLFEGVQNLNIDWPF